MTPNECSSCGIQLNADGTVDLLDDISLDEHFADCTARFEVVGTTKGVAGSVKYAGPSAPRPFRYGMARDLMVQRRAMTGPRVAWSIVTIA